MRWVASAVYQLILGDKMRDLLIYQTWPLWQVACFRHWIIYSKWKIVHRFSDKPNRYSWIHDSPFFSFDRTKEIYTEQSVGDQGRLLCLSDRKPLKKFGNRTMVYSTRKVFILILERTWWVVIVLNNQQYNLPRGRVGHTFLDEFSSIIERNGRQMEFWTGFGLYHGCFAAHQPGETS